MGRRGGGGAGAGQSIPWSEAEDRLLCAIVHEFGSNWFLVADVLSGSCAMQGIYRSPHTCRYRFRSLTVRAPCTGLLGPPCVSSSLSRQQALNGPHCLHAVKPSLLLVVPHFPHARSVSGSLKLQPLAAWAASAFQTHMFTTEGILPLFRGIEIIIIICRRGRGRRARSRARRARWRRCRLTR